MSKISQNKGGDMFYDQKSKRFLACKNEFNDMEIMFIINAINRRSKSIKHERNEINEMCVNWMYYFLVDINHELQTAGRTLAECINIKLFHHLQGIKRKIELTPYTSEKQSQL